MVCDRPPVFYCVIYGEAKCVRCKKLNHFKDYPVSTLCTCVKGGFRCPESPVTFDWHNNKALVDDTCCHCDLYQTFSVPGSGRVAHDL